MKRTVTTLAISLAGIFGTTLFAADTRPAFQEVYEILRTNLSSLTGEELNRSAVDGLLHELRGQASLVGDGSTNRALAGFFTVDSAVSVACISVLNSSLPDELTAGFRSASATNKLKGLVLDLRFATGDDYGAAAAVTGLFVTKERGLLDWGNGLKKSTAETVVIDLPVAVLVNRETLGAPEALAGVMREAGVALLVGNRTAGRARAGRDILLQSGHTLRVASAPVRLADGSEISSEGLQPDIAVAVTLEQERTIVQQSAAAGFADRMSSASNVRGRTRRPNEADLVRERRGETNQIEETASRTNLPAVIPVSDPALARAIDLLKGLAAVRLKRGNP